MHPEDLQTMDHSSWNPKSAKTFLKLKCKFRPINQFPTISLTIFAQILASSSLGLPGLASWGEFMSVVSRQFASKYTV